MRACDHRTLSATCSLATYGGMCSIFCGTTDGCTAWRARHTMLHLPAFGGTPVRHTASPMTQLHATVGSIHGRASPCQRSQARQRQRNLLRYKAPLRGKKSAESHCTIELLMCGILCFPCARQVQFLWTESMLMG